MSKNRSTRALALWAGAGLAILCLAMLAGVRAQGQGAAQAAPKYKFDPGWPKPLPNKWKMGGVTGLAVDKDDTVWVYDRPNDLTNIELEAELNPPIADCCVLPPSMIHFDKDGNVIGSFAAPQGHGMDVDSKGFVYIGQNTVRKYDTKTGKLVGEMPHVARDDRRAARSSDRLIPNRVFRVRAAPDPLRDSFPSPGARARGGRGGNQATAARAAARRRSAQSIRRRRR